MKHWTQDTNWQRLSDVVDRLKARVERTCRNEDHDDLITAEWRMRQAEKRAGQ